MGAGDLSRLEPTRALALRVWWAFLWRAALGAAASGFVVGVALGVLAPLGLSRQALSAASTVLGGAIGLSVSVEMMYRVLKKRFATFEVALIERHE